MGDGTVGYATDGTPVDCVRLAQLGLVEGFVPDVIVAGINHGANLGDDITYSGTVGRRARGGRARPAGHRGLQQSAAREMDFRLGHEFDFSVAARFVARVVDELDDLPLPAGTLLNVNVPAGEPSGVEGRAPGQAHLPRRAQADRPRGGPPALLDLRRGPGLRDEPGTDLAAVAAGRIAVTPITST